VRAGWNEASEPGEGKRIKHNYISNIYRVIIYLHKLLRFVWLREKKAKKKKIISHYFSSSHTNQMKMLRYQVE